MKVSPKEMLDLTKAMQKNIDKTKSLAVAVGLPLGEATSKIYEDGTTVVQVGSYHEYGTSKIPMRSFLRVPFTVKGAAIVKALAIAYRDVFEKGIPAETQLEKVGAFLQNISREAFSNSGFGSWKALKPGTIKAKGSSGTLIDTGTLKGSITYEVRNAS